jgi:diguanylate cyclase (GGDEF)-like protein
MAGEPARETAGVTTRLIVTYVRDRAGDEGVRRLLELAGEQRDVSVLEDERSWSSYDQKVALFEAAAEVTGDALVARRIGESVLEQRVAGSLRLVVAALGSPQQVLRSVARANAKFSTTATMRCLDVADGSAVVTYRLHDGYTPSVHDCRYTQGLLTQATALFDLPPAAIDHPACQVQGHGACRYELSWPRWRRAIARWLPRRPSPRVRSETDALRDQVVDLQQAVADLVSSDDLDEVLRRIATRASAAVRGREYLLAVQLEDEGTPRIHSDGLSPKEAQRRGTALLAGSGEDHADSALVARVATARHHHGWLAAYLPADTGFLPAERPQLEAYASLAAAALDASTALEQARRRGAIAQALLTLTHELAHEEDERSIASRVVEAVPSVTGASRASLLTWDEAALRLRAVAVHGYRELREQARQLEIPLDATPALHAMLRDPQPAVVTQPSDDPWMQRMLQAFGSAAVAAAPIVVHGTFTGVVFASWTLADGMPDLRPSLLRALASLGDQASIALANVRLLDQARYQATHDALTGLANRVLFHDQVQQAVADHRRTGRLAAICFLDLDGFKAVNDRYGHAAGDQLLVLAAERIRGCVRESDGVARLSGDEFGVLARGLDDPSGAELVARQLVEVLGRPFELDAGTAHVSVSVGVALVGEHGETPEDLLRRSDAAMYVAKRERGTFRLADRGQGVEAR